MEFLVYNTALHHGLYISCRLLFYGVFVLGFSGELLKMKEKSLND